jgi:RND family efflux transporter MFP subunit
MARHNLSAVIRYLKQLTGPAPGEGASDAELLERYVRCRDQAAFELLLWRHGALVYNVCRRILSCEQDVEDAFQATFLAFVRKAKSISRRGSVASWLYKVAYRIALEARERKRKTATAEKRGGEMLAVQPADDLLWSDMRPILDEELNRLPERLRRPIVLCYLEGKSNAEAARELGCRLGTIYSRLSRGRELLRQRLQCRGVTLPVAALTAALTARAAEAAPALSLVRAAARAALAFADRSALAAVSPQVASLAEGVLRTMFITKLKIAVVMLLVLGVAAGGVWTQARTAAPQSQAKAEDPPPKPADGDKKKDAEPIPVKVVKPQKGGLPKTIVEEGRVQAAQQQELVPLISGTIKEVAVDVGDRVKKGQVLVLLDAPLVLNEVEQAQAALEMAQAQREGAKVAVTEAERQVRSGAADLWKVERAKADLKAAEAHVRLAQAALDKAKIQASFTRLTAEFDGVIAERHCDPGNLVQSGASGKREPLLKLVRIDRLRVKVFLPLKFARAAERGDPVELSAEGISYGAGGSVVRDSGVLIGDPEDFITGKIGGISPLAFVIEGQGYRHLREVVIDVANPKNRLVPGQAIGAQISFSRTRRADAFTVPLSCVARAKRADHKDFVYVVYVVRNGKAYSQVVAIDNVLKDECDVVQGIQANDLVILEPGEWNDGTPVKIEKAR